MIRGIDTTFPVELEVAELAGHQAARARLQALLAQGDSLGVAPQVLAEFIHVVTDPKRFSQPLTMPAAVTRAQTW